MKTPPKALLGLTASLIAIVVALAWSLASLRPASPGEQLNLTEARAALADPAQIAAVVLRDQDRRLVIDTVDGRKLWAAYPEGPAAAVIVTDLAAAGVPVLVDQQVKTRLLAVFGQYILPLLLLANLFGIFILLARGGARQVRDLFAFSRLQSKQATTSSATGFGDAAGVESAVEELAEVRDYLRDPAAFATMGARPPKGVLLFGPPGCGKTLLARALAGEARVPFFYISGSEFVESLVGVGAARVRDLFVQALAAAPAIVFIDELDAAGRRRGAGVGGGHDEREQTLNELLVQMDGFAPTAGVVVIGATNRPDILDPALLRPGRFDRHVLIEAPDVEGRREILALHARRHRLGADADLDKIARATPGFSGADLANVLNEAALLAVRRRAGAISHVDLLEGVDRVSHGPKRRGHLLDDEELRRLAYHEAGHAVVAHATGRAAGTRISLVARGRDIAHTATTVDADRSLLTASELRAQLTVLMAGAAAEILECDELSTASEGDLERATDIARRYAGRYGMSDTIGRIRVLHHDAEVFLGRDLLASHDTSHHTLQALDEAVAELIAIAEKEALATLQQRRRVLSALANALIESESLDEDQVAAILASPQRGRAATRTV